MTNSPIGKVLTNHVSINTPARPVKKAQKKGVRFSEDTPTRKLNENRRDLVRTPISERLCIDASPDPFTNGPGEAKRSRQLGTPSETNEMNNASLAPKRPTLSIHFNGNESNSANTSSHASINHASQAPIRPVESIHFNCQDSTIIEHMDYDSNLPENQFKPSYFHNTNVFQNQMIQSATNFTGTSSFFPRPSVCRSLFGNNSGPVFSLNSAQTRVPTQNVMTDLSSTWNSGIPNHPTQKPSLQFRQQSFVPLNTVSSASSYQIPVAMDTFDVYTDLEPMDTDENVNLAEEDYMELDESVYASMDYEEAVHTTIYMDYSPMH